MKGLGLLLLGSTALFAQTPDGLGVFEKIVRPALAANCYACHSSKADKPAGGLLLDSKAGMLKGGNSGVPAVVPFKPDESVIVAAVRGAGALTCRPARSSSPMKSKGWRSGSSWGRPIPAATPSRSLLPTIGPKPASTGPFSRCTIPAAPASTPSSRRSSTSKAGAAAARLQAGAHPPRHLRPHRPAAHARRRGRLSQGQSPRRLRKGGGPPARLPAVRRKVGPALAGCRALRRHLRRQFRLSRCPSMFRYRNWVIAAFNADKPYDQFVRDQIAGDIIAAQRRPGHKNKEEWQQKIIATGYLANSRRFGSRMPGVPPHHRRHDRQPGQGHSSA